MSGAPRPALPAPRVSVLLPVRDGEAYLGEAIESVLAGDYRDFELLVIDDGSRDASREIARAFARRDPRVSLLPLLRSGLVPALNAGLARTRGEYVARMDADDRSRRERLAAQVAYLDAHPGCAALGCAYLEIDDEGWPIGVRDVPASHAEILERLLGGLAGALPHAACVLRRSALQALGVAWRAHPEAEDLDLFLRLAERGELANLPQPLFEVRRHAASTTRTRSPERARQCKRELANAARARHGLPPLAAGAPAARDPGPASLALAWARRALSAGNLATARKHARRALKASPWSPAAWRIWLAAQRAR